MQCTNRSVVGTISLAEARPPRGSSTTRPSTQEFDAIWQRTAKHRLEFGNGSVCSLCGGMGSRMVSCAPIGNRRKLGRLTIGPAGCQPAPQSNWHRRGRAPLRSCVSRMNVSQHSQIAIAGNLGGSFPKALRVGGRPCSQAVYIAVVHAEGRRNQHGVVNLQVGGALLPRACDIFGLNVLSATLYFTGDSQQRLEFAGDIRALKIALYRLNRILVSTEVMRRNRAMGGLAVVAIVARRDIGGDQFALPGC